MGIYNETSGRQLSDAEALAAQARDLAALYEKTIARAKKLDAVLEWVEEGGRGESAVPEDRITARGRKAKSLRDEMKDLCAIACEDLSAFSDASHAWNESSLSESRKRLWQFQKLVFLEPETPNSFIKPIQKSLEGIFCDGSNKDLYHLAVKARITNEYVPALDNPMEQPPKKTSHGLRFVFSLVTFSGLLNAGYKINHDQAPSLKPPYHPNSPEEMLAAVIVMTGAMILGTSILSWAHHRHQLEVKTPFFDRIIENPERYLPGFLKEAEEKARPLPNDSKGLSWVARIAAPIFNLTR